MAVSKDGLQYRFVIPGTSGPEANPSPASRAGQALLRAGILAPGAFGGDRCQTLSPLKKRSAAAFATRLPGTDICSIQLCNWCLPKRLS